MSIDNPSIGRIFQASLALFLSFFVLTGCKSVNSQAAGGLNFQQNHNLDQFNKFVELNTRENELAAREAAISAREAELVTLLAELLKQKKALEENLAEKTTNHKKISPTPTPTAQQTAGNQNATKISQARPAAYKNNGNTTKDGRIILGGLENVYLDPPGMEFPARIDTGAQTSSLNAIDMIEFERDGEPYVKFHVIHPQTSEKIELTRRVRGHVRIKEVNERKSQRRPVVKMHVILGGIDEQIKFTLVDRSKFKQQVLIGRNFLRDLAIVDVSKEFTVPKINQGKHEAK